MISFSITDTSQVAEVRRHSVAMATSNGLKEADVGRVSIVATELATNLLKHAPGGEILIGGFQDAAGGGMEFLALDRGRGMESVQECLRDGYSTAGSPGTGLGAIMRQSEFVDIFSHPGQGTAILARLRAGRSAPAETSTSPRWGAVCLPKPGEAACGDAWSAASDADGYTLLVADGLGHGPLAAEAALEAVRIFGQFRAQSPANILEAVHAGLRPTRGAAVAIARINHAGTVVFAGIGNIAGTLVSDGQARKMVSHNGTAGHAARRIRDFVYPFASTPLVVLHSDGLGTSWDLNKYPGLATRDPSTIAGVLYRDFTRGRDDVTVLVATGDAA